MDKRPNHISQEQQEEFEQFLLGNMNLDEERGFQQKMETNPELATKFDEFKNLFFAIEEEGLRNVLDTFHSSVENQSIFKKTSYNIYKIAAGIAILLSLGLWFFNQPNSNEKLFNSYFSADPGLPTVMGTQDNYPFYEAMVDYKQGNYDIAIEKWEKLLISKPTNDTLQYFLGASYLATDNIEMAISRLNNVSDRNNSIFYDDINFNLGLAFLKKNEIEKAKLSLSKSNTAKSKKLLSQLK